MPKDADNIIEVTDDSFDYEVLQATTPVLVDFWALWCGHCIRFTPTIEQVAKNFTDKVKFVKVDADKSPALVNNYNIRSIPTLILFNAGKIAATNNGVLDKTHLTDFIKNHLPPL